MVDCGHKGTCCEGTPEHKLNLFRVCISLTVGLGDRNLVEQASFLNEKAALASLGCQIKERDLTYAFLSLEMEGGNSFWWLVMQWVKIFHLLKRNYVVVVQIAQLWLASMKTISCVQ